MSSMVSGMKSTELPHPFQTARMILADVPDILPTSRDGKNDGYGGLLSVGLILLAICVTIIVFWRNRQK